MKNLQLLFGVLSVFFAVSSGFGGRKWNATFAEIRKRVNDLPAPIAGPHDSDELLGDLVRPGPRTQVGQAVANIILGREDGQSNQANYFPAPLGTQQCGQDTCCVWKYIAEEMAQKFTGDAGRCNLYARGAIRLGFHDAASWRKGMDYGGADGSILLNDEMSRPANFGLEEIVGQMRIWYNKYSPYGVGAADLVQMGANVATVVCPLGPRVRSFVGRIDDSRMPPDGLLPDANADADSLLRLFEDKTIKPHGLVTLVGAHTTSQQRFFKPERAFDPQDTTPGVWDVLLYAQTLTGQTPERVLRFPSDVKISRHPKCVQRWVDFADPGSGQQRWNDEYAKEYVRMSMLGVNNINNLVECTKVLPPARPVFNPPDTNQVNQWLSGGFANYGNTLGQILNDGHRITNNSLMSNGINPGDGFNYSPPPPGSPFNRPPPRPIIIVIPPPPPRPQWPSHTQRPPPETHWPPPPPETHRTTITIRPPPTETHRSTFTIRPPPTETHRSTFTIRPPPTDTHRTTVTIRPPPDTHRPPPFTTRPPPETHRTTFTIRPPPETHRPPPPPETHRSTFTIRPPPETHRPPPYTYRPPETHRPEPTRQPNRPFETYRPDPPRQPNRPFETYRPDPPRQPNRPFETYRPDPPRQQPRPETHRPDPPRQQPRPETHRSDPPRQQPPRQQPPRQQGGRPQYRLLDLQNDTLSLKNETLNLQNKTVSLQNKTLDVQNKTLDVQDNHLNLTELVD